LIYIQTKNQGDEAAYNVQMTAEVNGVQKSSETRNTLGVQEAFSADLELDLSMLERPGTYPVMVRIDYADANGYPFSALTPSRIDIGEPTSSAVSVDLGDVSVTEEGKTTMTAKLRNKDSSPKTLYVSLATPKELFAEGEKTVEISGNGEADARFEIESFGALKGSSYAVFAVAEYDEEKHYSSIARGTVEIVEERIPFEVIYGLIALFIVLLGVFIYIYITKRKKGKDESISSYTDSERGKESSDSPEGPSKD
jgi:hypothetical protein